MKKYVFLFGCILIFPSFGYSQDYDHFNIKDLLRGYYIKTSTPDTPAGYTGSPYDNDKFSEGSLETTSKKIIKDIPLRMNIYNDNVEYKGDDGQIYEVSNPEKFDYFKIGDTKIRYLPYYGNKKIKKGYFKIMEEGAAMLLDKPKVILEPATTPGAYRDAKPANFKRLSDDYYIKVADTPAQTVSNKKNLLKHVLKTDNVSSAKKIC